jgi:vacuolar iron transporter family protein
MPSDNKARHRTGRIGWLRATVLGANDGILSTSSLLLGVAAAHATHSNVLVAGVASLVAGAMSMAVVSTCLSSHRQTPNRPTSPLSARNSRQTTRASTRN